LAGSRVAAGADGCGEDDGGESREASCEPGHAEGAEEEGASGVAEFSADFGGAHGLPHPPGWRDLCESGEAQRRGDTDAGTDEDAGVAAYISVRFLVRFFETRNLLPFAIYCLVAGGLCIIRFA
jgi:hypothetical protein